LGPLRGRKALVKAGQENAKRSLKKGDGKAALEKETITKDRVIPSQKANFSRAGLWVPNTPYFRLLPLGGTNCEALSSHGPLWQNAVFSLKTKRRGSLFATTTRPGGGILKLGYQFSGRKRVGDPCLSKGKGCPRTDSHERRTLAVKNLYERLEKRYQEGGNLKDSSEREIRTIRKNRSPLLHLNIPKKFPPRRKNRRS